MLCDVLLSVVVFVRRIVRVSLCSFVFVSVLLFILPMFFFFSLSPMFLVGIFRYRSVFSYIFSFVVHDEVNFCSRVCESHIVVLVGVHGSIFAFFDCISIIVVFRPSLG